MGFTDPTFVTNTIQSLADQPTETASEVKQAFDKAAADIKTYLTALNDELEATTDGNSGMDNIGMTPIDGVMTTPQQSLEFLKNRVDATQPTLNVVSVLDKGAVGDGVADDTDAFNSAIADLPSDGGTILVPTSIGYRITSTINCGKPVNFIIGSTTIIADLSGYLFNIQVNNSSIIGNSKSTLKAMTGCTALIFNNQTLHCNYENLVLDLNNIANVVGLFHYGGWYLSAKNIFIDRLKEAVSAHSLIIRSIYTGVPGSTGSYGGAYVSRYDNFIGGKVIIDATLPNKTTTITFVGCSLTSITASDSTSLTFLQPVIQGNLNFFSLTNVAGLTCLGGDFEITPGGQVYAIQDTNCRDIVSIGNQCISGVTTANYLVGQEVGAGCVFDDKGISGADDESLRYGSLPLYTLKNSNYDTKHRFGCHYDGDILIASNNLKLISGTQGNLDDTSKNGIAIYTDTSDQFKVMFASAGTNPRTLTEVFLLTSGAVKLPNLRNSEPLAGSKELWYDPTDANTVKYKA